MTDFFQLDAPEHLFGKLTRDLERFERAPTDCDMAFNFFVTAESILDWLHPGRGKEVERKRKALRNREPALVCAWELSRGAKHRKPDPDYRTATPAVSHIPGARWQIVGRRHQPIMSRPPQIVSFVDLKGKAKDKYGHRISTIELARLVHAYWKTKFSKRSSRKAA